MIVVPFQPAHFSALQAQPSQAWMMGVFTPAQVAALALCPSFTGLHEGEVVGCAGTIPFWSGRVMAWAMLSARAGGHMVAVHRAVKRFLETCDARRIEATVDIDFEPGHRWMGALGFTLEAPRMDGYRPDGRACSIYAKVRQ